MSNEQLREALQACLDATEMSPYGDYSKIEWESSAGPINPRWGCGDCKKHGHWYGRCDPCSDEWDNLCKQADRDAYTARENALNAAKQLARQALATTEPDHFEHILDMVEPSQPVTEQETLVGLSIHGKELRNENIVYDGGPLDLTDCKFLSCYIEFSKAAARTVQFLAIAEQSQPGLLQPLFADAVSLTKPLQPVTLTDEEICECFGIDGADDWVFKGAHAIIATLRGKEQTK